MKHKDLKSISKKYAVKIAENVVKENSSPNKIQQFIKDMDIPKDVKMVLVMYINDSGKVTYSYLPLKRVPTSHTLGALEYIKQSFFHQEIKFPDKD